MSVLATPRFFHLVILSLVALLLQLALSPASARELTSTNQADRYGLQRAWFSHVSVNANRSYVVEWKLYNDRLYALTSAGVLQAMDAETGATVWTKSIGRPDGSFPGLGANDNYVGVISGTTLHLLDPEEGHLRVSHYLEGAPAAAPVMSKRYVFVAMSNGKVEAFSLDNPEESPWFHQSIGRIFHEPTVTNEVVSWPTDRGFLYVSQANVPRVLFRVETGGEIVAPPAELKPYLYIASRDGYLYCVHELSGVDMWKWSTGFPIINRPAAVGNTVYVASEEPALHALDHKSGRPRWIAPGVQDFVMEGKRHVYGLDSMGYLVVIEKESGGVLGRFWTGEQSTALVNDQSDRIFLVSETGLVQCFHEAQSPEPTYYRLQPVDESDAETDGPEVNPFEAGDTGDAFTTEPDSPGDTGSPFGTSDDSGFGAPAATDDDSDENVFGF